LIIAFIILAVLVAVVNKTPEMSILSSVASV